MSPPIPEPSGIAATLGLAALAFAARKRREK
ncbi:MAG: PEP-CTERM sorting domain-containing protein [Opitutales bacterium]|nr:PEP-CTERM sorting domain-containing protein [Opitutales bacterium]